MMFKKQSEYPSGKIPCWHLAVLGIHKINYEINLVALREISPFSPKTL